MERNEEQWRQLLTSAGFEITRIWRAELGTTAIIEADIKRIGGNGGMDGKTLPSTLSAGLENGFAGVTDGFEITPNALGPTSHGADMASPNPIAANGDA